MLTPEQEQWIAHLPDDGAVKIVPFNPASRQVFERMKNRIHELLGDDVPYEHHGATSLGISGQDEIDTYIPVSADMMTPIIHSLTRHFGKSLSDYPQERVRFATEIDGKHIDIFLLNKDHQSWKSAMRFESYIRSHPEALEEYTQLKENGHGLTIREYYRRKIEFMNTILAKGES